MDKQALLARLGDYLDSLDELPDTTPEAPDLYTLLTELATLKNEVQRESRQVKTALDEFRGVYADLQTANERLGSTLTTVRDEHAEAIDKAEEALIRELLELHDRLQAGVQQAGQFRPGPLCWGGKTVRFVRSLQEGIAINQRRLEQLLNRYEVQTVAPVGEVFSAQTMYAYDTTETSAHADGVVVEVVRNGYWRHGKSLRLAEVIVNKRRQRPWYSGAKDRLATLFKQLRQPVVRRLPRRRERNQNAHSGTASAD